MPGSYLSIPQRNPVLKELSISSLGVYSSFAKYFVIIAPSCTHHNSFKPVDKETYQRRGWCRLEQWARMTVGGLQNMFLFQGGEMIALDGERKWYTDSIRVFDGDFTVDADKKKIVDTSIGLWSQALVTTR